MGSAYGCLPSDILHITDELAAINFDMAVLVVGRKAENQAYEDVKKDSKKPSKARPKLGSWRSLGQQMGKL